MKVLMFNGSRKDEGCSFTALNFIGNIMKESGVDFEIINVGRRVFNGEIEDVLKEAQEKVKDAAGFIVASPVYYASPSGEIVMFLDRLFSSSGADLRFKPAASVSTCRRAGNSSTLDVINKYFAYNSMPIVSSCYWNEIHGKVPEDVLKDEEGLQILRTLGKNMVWLLKSIQAGKDNGIVQPSVEEKIYTNFIR